MGLLPETRSFLRIFRVFRLIRVVRLVRTLRSAEVAMRTSHRMWIADLYVNSNPRGKGWT